MINYEILRRIQNVIIYKKFDIFYNKYLKKETNLDIKKAFFSEFKINDKFSEEYILFLEYLTNKKRWV